MISMFAYAFLAATVFAMVYGAVKILRIIQSVRE